MTRPLTCTLSALLAAAVHRTRTPAAAVELANGALLEIERRMSQGATVVIDLGEAARTLEALMWVARELPDHALTIGLLLGCAVARGA
jgi:hypothetical protein